MGTSKAGKSCTPFSSKEIGRKKSGNTRWELSFIPLRLRETSLRGEIGRNEMKSIVKRSMVWILCAFLSVPWPVSLNAQTAAAPFKPEEIEQLAAPIALYPDSLVSQILMAST